MPGAVKLKLLLYADDSAILVSGKCRHDIENILSSEMDVLSQWLISNKLSLHLGKIHTIWFKAKVESTAIFKCYKQWSHT